MKKKMRQQDLEELSSLTDPESLTDAHSELSETMSPQSARIPIRRRKRKRELAMTFAMIAAGIFLALMFVWLFSAMQHIR